MQSQGNDSATAGHQQSASAADISHHKSAVRLEALAMVNTVLFCFLIFITKFPDIYTIVLIWGAFVEVKTVFTLQRHSPEVLLQSLWKPLLVSQLHGPHMGLPHQP